MGPRGSVATFLALCISACGADPKTPPPDAVLNDADTPTDGLGYESEIGSDVGSGVEDGGRGEIPDLDSASPAGDSGATADTAIDAQVPEPPPMLVNVVHEPWGESCPRGGLRVETGPDLDRDGVLRSNEVTTVQTVCNVYPKAITAGRAHTCALASDGAVWCWGDDESLQLGDALRRPSYAPRPVDGAPAALALASGRDFSCVILPTTGARCWGSNDRGQIGHGPGATLMMPSCVYGVLNATALAAGATHACAALDDGSVRCWGANEAGQLGDGTTEDRYEAVSAGGIQDAVALTGGGRHTCALRKGGGVACWGANEAGQLGDGTTTDQHAPTGVLDDSQQRAPLQGVSALSAGEAHTCALLTEGSVRCWGADDQCQCGGLGGIGARANAPAVVVPSGAVALAAGRHHTCAVLESGRVVCWGANDSGQLAAPAGACHGSPVSVPVSRAISAAAGDAHTCALTETGTWCWGGGAAGQLGHGGTTGSPTPELVLWPTGP